MPHWLLLVSLSVRPGRYRRRRGLGLPDRDAFQKDSVLLRSCVVFEVRAATTTSQRDAVLPLVADLVCESRVVVCFEPDCIAARAVGDDRVNFAGGRPNGHPLVGD